ncbi:MAG: Rab family GTPase [Candidatus Helarchaeota archaeon]
MVKFTFKLVLLGDQAVGKTSLVLRYINNSFTEQYISTIGADFLIKDLELLGAPIRLMIWDLGGQTQWEHIRARYMQGSDACILVFDVNRELNIEAYINTWIREIRDFIGEKAPIIIVGNKIDLPAKVDLLKAARLIRGLGYPYIETSARTGDRVEAMFQRITADVVMQKAEIVKQLKGVQENLSISDIFNKIRERQ